MNETYSLSCHGLHGCDPSTQPSCDGSIPTRSIMPEEKPKPAAKTRLLANWTSDGQNRRNPELRARFTTRKFN